LFLGWELIGLTSFFLINFWSTKISTLKAAFKAFLFNKISDLGILIFILLNILILGESNILTLNSVFINFIDYKVNIIGLNISFIEFLAFFLMLSAFIKSAQFGFHVWLPDSMEAPVPASALIHSATLVSAGVFLLLRFSFLIELLPAQ
jgi:NADH-quinone oxidoreductase subunit L